MAMYKFDLKQNANLDSLSETLLSELLSGKDSDSLAQALESALNSALKKQKTLQEEKEKEERKERERKEKLQKEKKEKLSDAKVLLNAYNTYCGKWCPEYKCEGTAESIVESFECLKDLKFWF